MDNIIKAGPNTIKAHLDHLRDHGETGYFNEAVKVLQEKKIPNPLEGTMIKTNEPVHEHTHPGCPGARAMEFKAPAASGNIEGVRPSELRHWPIQLHLVSPNAPYFRGKDVLLAADCTAFAVGDFHRDFLKNKSLAIACPKLDEGLEVYEEKIRSMIDEAEINTLTVMIMQVPCCGGLLQVAQKAAQRASRKIPIKCIMVSLQGEVLKEEWV